MKSIKIFFAFVCSLLLFIQSAAAQESAAKINLHCPYCSTLNLAANKFCNTCGARLPVDRVENFSLHDSLTQLEQLAPFVYQNKEAETLYETAMAFIRQDQFAQAANCFHRIVTEYPAWELVRTSEQMARACDELTQAQKQSQQKTSKREPSNNAAFGGAFLGSLVGMAGTFLVIVALASGG